MQLHKIISEQLHIKVYQSIILILHINTEHTKAILLITDILSKSSTNKGTQKCRSYSIFRLTAARSYFKNIGQEATDSKLRTKQKGKTTTTL